MIWITLPVGKRRPCQPRPTSSVQRKNIPVNICTSRYVNYTRPWSNGEIRTGCSSIDRFHAFWYLESDAVSGTPETARRVGTEIALSRQSTNTWKRCRSIASRWQPGTEP